MNASRFGFLAKSFLWVKNQELLVLLLMLTVVLGLWAFLELADEVKEGTTRQLDEQVLRVFRNPADATDPVGPEWFEEAMRDITGMGGVAVLSLVGLGVIGFVWLQKQYHAFWLMLAAIGGGLMLNLVLKGMFSRPRPDLVPHLSYAMTSSFPSGHSMLSAVVYLTLAALLARLVSRPVIKVYIVLVALFFSLAVGVSRVYMGVHYPSDVLAGWTLGLLWAVICWLVARVLQKQGRVEKPNE